MSLLSITSKKTRVHLSADQLKTITCENSHTKEDCVSDAAILPLFKSFIQIFKSSKDTWINICKVKQEDDKENIQICLKNRAENLSAIAASKNKGSGLCFANGYSNGQIKIRDLKTSKVVKEFSPPQNASSVVFLDFNSSDEHLVSVHEDGPVNIYGMQTSVKLHSFPLDNQSTLARFHPQKRSHLGVASYSGKVSLLDIYAKKTIFKNDSHSAPCTDIAMTEDFLFSSGYDGIVKIFDLRKKSPGIQIQGSYGWTSICLSKCGVYFVGGNMKGELISYDLRHFKKVLSSARIEESNHKISRIGFLSCDDDSNVVDLSSAVRQSICKIEEEDCDGRQTAETNESFIEEVYGFQRGRISDFSSSAINYGTRVSSASRRSSTDSCFSDNYGGKYLQEALKDFSPSPFAENLDDSRVNKTKRRLSTKDVKLRASSGTVLQEICEELANDKENDAKTLNTEAPKTPGSLNVGPRYSSTPTVITKSADEKKSEIIEVDGDDSFKSVQNGDIPAKTEEIPAKTGEVVKVPLTFDFRKEFDALAEKVHIEVGSLNMDNNMRFLQLMTHVTEQKFQLQSRIHMIEECLAMFMNEDFKIKLITELQAENQQLRQQNIELTRRLSH